MGRASEYWATRYTDDEAILHHQRQNSIITRDFLAHIHQRKVFADAISLPSIIEIGCGTGEMAAKVKQLYDTRVYYATDFDRSAVKVAQARYPHVNFWVYDVLKDPACAYCYLALSSNTLEHFTDPHAVIRKMFILAQQVMILVPYNQPVTDGYEEEGGAGHVYTFTEDSFPDYTVVDWFTFETTGWTYSSGGEKPLQMAVLLNED